MCDFFLAQLHYFLLNGARDYIPRPQRVNRRRSWVMLTEKRDIVRLPQEEVRYVSPRRVSLTLTAPSSSTTNKNWNLNCEDGTIYVTTHRIIYLPHLRVDNMQSFSCPLERILSTKVDSPWIGPWFWKASIAPVPQGGIPDDLQVAELKLVFKNGGHSHFDSWVQIVMKQHAAVMEMSRATNRPAESIPREDLPSYQQPGPTEAPPAYHD